MRRIVCLFIALVMCLSIAAPVFAAENGFVPSITYKPDPEIVPVKDENGEEHLGVIRDVEGQVVDYVDDHGCFRVTPIADVWDPEIEVPEYIEELLIYVYEGLKEEELVIDYEKFAADLEASNMVVRDLFDLRWYCEEHNILLNEDGNTVDITFDLGVVADAEIYVATFDEETKEWSPIVKTVNNGDGTVTCTFEHFCAISFSMVMSGAEAPVDDVQAPNVLPWIIIIIVTLVAIVVILVIKNKKKAEA